MLAKVEDNPVAPDALWWPAMNFDQFRWDGTIGRYELRIPRADFVQRLSGVYAQCVRELQEDDRLVADQQRSPLRDAGYPSLETVLDNAETTFELVEVFIYENVFEAFLPHPPSAKARFMINSVDEVASTSESVLIRGRGYHGGPGFANCGGPAAG
ncbi:hypothetical protein [Humisphaera borealis]|uniref:Uncharacterized protein n=1 Tax=Humisphaera borealis TaxID=2807512 RepID=A0A7M2WXJ3_9BACT|nr:hypothetical protein [Humisphaera borealis]QOV90215.1 hypothetical protein IPV69_02245 [Humisphaera borealis]